MQSCKGSSNCNITASCNIRVCASSCNTPGPDRSIAASCNVILGLQHANLPRIRVVRTVASCNVLSSSIVWPCDVPFPYGASCRSCNTPGPDCSTAPPCNIILGLQHASLPCIVCTVASCNVFSFSIVSWSCDAPFPYGASCRSCNTWHSCNSS